MRLKDFMARFDGLDPESTVDIYADIDGIDIYITVGNKEVWATDLEDA